MAQRLQRSNIFGGRNARFFGYFSEAAARMRDLFKIGVSRAALKYGLAIAMTCAAWTIDLLLQNSFNEISSGLFIVAAMISAWYGGLSSALVSVALTIGINIAFFNHPHLSLAVGLHGPERLIVFSLASLLVSALTARMRASSRSLIELNHDLEERVQARTAALEESNRQLEAFCYTLAHDLRAPLRSIQGFSQLLVAEHGNDLDPGGRDFAQRIGNSAERMGRLILDLLAYTDLSRANLKLQRVSLERVVQRVLQKFGSEIATRQAEVSVDPAFPDVRGNSAWVERALSNMLDNALKFGQPDRDLRIAIRAEIRNRFVRIRVDDNGIGFDPKRHPYIFDVFVRLPVVEDQSGTGIGLAMVKKSVEKMGGQVGVESEPGIGSRFWFELPVVEGGD
ncbi:MAG TPA: HAMP domain-containing sensor histidine kinase [Verrucomicrobiae bacterium]|nr:HAMP domain-containing sensor histidine kinase [Verrucomicrobiae bacterium]